MHSPVAGEPQTLDPGLSHAHSSQRAAINSSASAHVAAPATVRRIRNMMSRTEALFHPVDGRIPADQALEWLRGRPTQFRQSLWMAQDPDEMPDFEPGHIEKVVFVPVGADGSVFHPGLSRDGHFLLGAGAEDLKVDSFEEALAELQSMVTPVWRRPTGHDRWTRVQGVRWERMTMELLEATAAEG